MIARGHRPVDRSPIDLECSRSFAIGKQINNFDISQSHSGIGHSGLHERASLNRGTGGPRCNPYLYVPAGELQRNEAHETGNSDAEIGCSRRGGPIGGQSFTTKRVEAEHRQQASLPATSSVEGY